MTCCTVYIPTQIAATIAAYPSAARIDAQRTVTTTTCEESMASRYDATFTDADINGSGFLTLGATDGVVTHSLSTERPTVVVENENGDRVEAPITYLTTNTVSVYLANFQPLTGTWGITVRR